ncbi:hypothetical protein KHA80_15880 [Anaerobacillus sp. HL2]|nr:hypothetical protein KHA80_15880 [Anaerobacillus sp. HL2]
MASRQPYTLDKPTLANTDATEEEVKEAKIPAPVTSITLLSQGILFSSAGRTYRTNMELKNSYCSLMMLINCISPGTKVSHSHYKIEVVVNCLKEKTFENFAFSTISIKKNMHILDDSSSSNSYILKKSIRNVRRCSIIFTKDEKRTHLTSNGIVGKH